LGRGGRGNGSERGRSIGASGINKHEDSAQERSVGGGTDSNNVGDRGSKGGSPSTKDGVKEGKKGSSQQRRKDINLINLVLSCTLCCLDQSDTLKVTPYQLRSRGLSFVGFLRERQNVSERKNNERFAAHFGMPVPLTKLCQDLKDEFPLMKEKELFMGLSFLRSYPTMSQMAGQWDCHEDTARSTWKKVVKMIASLREKKIRFNMADFDDDTFYLLTIDGVHFTVNEQRKDPGPKWYDHKSHSAGVGYEMGVAIRESSIVWINGPFPGENEMRFQCLLHVFIPD
jgi:hypothetical protein